MMTCSKCGVEKDESNYQRYFHSTQNKWRVRKECTECYYKTRLKRKNPDLYYQSNPNYKKCITCKEWKNLEEYYFHQKAKGIRFNDCIECHRKKDRREREEYLENNCGSNQILSTPNEYFDKHQKGCVFNLMELLGYIYNEDSGVWTKPGVKEIIDGNIVFFKLKKTKKIGVYKTKINQTTLKMIIDYKQRGWNNQKIASKLDISDTTVYKYYKEWKDTSK